MSQKLRNNMRNQVSFEKSINKFHFGWKIHNFGTLFHKFNVNIMIIIRCIHLTSIKHGTHKSCSVFLKLHFTLSMQFTEKKKFSK